MSLAVATNLRSPWRDPRWLPGALFVIVLLSRLPFLNAGYGVNVDAWRVARVAREMAITGNYSVSRFPGYPVQEIVCAWFWRGGPWALNGITALLGAAAVTAFAASARKLGCRDWFLAGLALAVTPIFFISSVCSKDYVWALSFILLSLFCVLHGKAGLAGLFLGLATGCRLTSFAMVVPLALILGSTNRFSLRSLACFGLTSVISALIAFSPVWLRYGMSFFTFYSNHAQPDWPTIVARGTIEVWGALGLAGLFVAWVSLLWPGNRFPGSRRTIGIALLLVIVTYTIAYLRLPDQAGYLLPIVPAVLLAAQLFCPRRAFQIACACLLLTPLVEISQRRVATGAIVTDHQMRLRTMTNIRNFIGFAESLPGRNTFVIGAWEPQIAVMNPEVTQGRNCYAYLMNAADVAATYEAGRAIYYLPATRQFNYQVTGVDLARVGARDLRSLYERQVTAPANP